MDDFHEWCDQLVLVPCIFFCATDGHIWTQLLHLWYVPIVIHFSEDEKNQIYKNLSWGLGKHTPYTYTFYKPIPAVSEVIANEQKLLLKLANVMPFMVTDMSRGGGRHCMNK